MNNLIVQAGDVVVTQFDTYQHWSLVSDRICPDGKNMLISATKRTGTVQEEPWDDVTKGKHSYVAISNSEKPIYQILSDARSQIDNWIYSIKINNSQHFIKWCSCIKVSSLHAKADLEDVIVAALAEVPKAVKIVGGAVLLGGLAVTDPEAIEALEVEG